MPEPRILIAIDLQRGFVTDCSRHVLAPIARLQDRFEQVVFTRFYNPESSPFRRILDYQKLSPGSDETELAITPRTDARILARPLYTCVTDELRGWLRQWRAEEVHICGIATEACIFKTVADLFEADIRPWVIEDLCASDQDKRYHDMAIELMAKLVGKEYIIRSAELDGRQAKAG